MKKPLLECCVDTVESAVAAKEGGADRLELCANLIIGGTTPDINLYHRIREKCDILINHPSKIRRLLLLRRGIRDHPPRCQDVP
mgnify:CR=1 FL=1